MKKTICSAVNGHHVEIVREAMLCKNLKEIINAPCVLFHLAKEKALKFDITPPQGTVLRELKEDYVTQMHKSYPFGHWHTPLQFAILVKFNVNIGLFNEKTGELMAWCLRYPNGLLTALQVEEKHKRKGYAEVVVKAMAKMLAMDQEDSYATIVTGNSPSQGLFEKLKYINTELVVTWMEFRP